MNKKSKANSALTPMPNLRKPAYALFDGVAAIQMAASSDPTLKGDQKFKVLLEAVERASDALHDHLSSNYNWD